MSRGDGGLRLTLVRHGRAESASPGQADFERALDRRGLAEVAGMARRCLEHDLVPDALRASAALRTRQTAEAFARVLGLPPGRLQVERGLYLAEADALLESIRETGDDVAHLMVVGHNPGIGELARQFAPRARIDGFETAAILTLNLEATAWHELRVGDARGMRYDSPARFYDLWS